jgi:hypothetical protein
MASILVIAQVLLIYSIDRSASEHTHTYILTYIHTYTHTYICAHMQTTGEMFLPATLLKYAPLLIAPEPETAASVADAQALFAHAAQIPIRKQ